MDSINPGFKKYNKQETADNEKLLTDLRSGNRAALSRALTLIESKLPSDRKQAEELIENALPYSGNSIRIGISGVPGVGKSTFIEAFGEHLTRLGKKVAVLAIDPSSSKNRGSILGDKTRMYKLSQNPNAFIRPSPAAGTLGGVAHKTRESILLCESAGFDVIIIETVGVGQSETTVKSMVDFFLLLMLAGAGDELQGIKRGIMEMADLLVINKADGNNLQAAKNAHAEYKRALHLFPPNENEWIPRVQIASALNNEGIDEVWQTISEFESSQRIKGFIDSNRQMQAIEWFQSSLHDHILQHFYEKEGVKDKTRQLKVEIVKGKISVGQAVKELLNPS